jgi:hypothetical protein
MSARLAAALRFDEIERRAAEGRPLADGEGSRRARQEYLDVYWQVRSRIVG